MRIVAEYDIKIAKEPHPVSLYRLPQINKNLRIEKIRHKPQSRYLEVDMTLPKMGLGLQRTRGSDGSNVMTYESYGAIPQSDHWYGKIVHDKKVILLRRVECIYLFSPKFKHLEVVDKEQSVDGYQFRKAESREEQEHRKRNINFQIKKMDQEDFVTLEYSGKEQSQDYEDLQPQRVNPITQKPVKMVERSIFNAKVVSFSELVYLYKDEEMVKLALSRSTNFRHGRYILSNLFYEKSLHDIRDRILSLFDERERILAKDVEPFIKKEYFLLDELCRKDGKFFYLKGSYECPDEAVEGYGGDGVSKISMVIEEHQPCSMELIQHKTLLDVDFIRANVSRANGVELANGMFAIYGGGEKRKKILDLLVNRKSWKKADVLRIAQSGDFGSIEEFLDIFGEYCNLKGATWSIKE